LKDEFRVVSFDFRDHGNSYFNSLGASKICDETDFSANTLINDTIEVLEYVVKKFTNTSIILMGHAMGGSIVTKTAAKILQHKTEYSWHTSLKGMRAIIY
jgi:pimeloyl-ACP methyl ester carboxylesterase